MLSIQAAVIGKLLEMAINDYVAPALAIGASIALMSHIISMCRSEARPSNSGMYAPRASRAVESDVEEFDVPDASGMHLN